MNGPRASNPSASSAAPAKEAATKSGKESASGAASASPSYEERNRQEDPVPVAEDKPTTSVILSACQFLSKPPDLAIEKDFEVSCQATWSGDQAPESLRLTFKILMKWDEGAIPKEEEALEELEAHLDAAKSEQTATAKGTLPRPPSFPADGTKVVYRAVASHPAAASTSESEAVELVLRERVHYAEVPDILFAHGGHFPCLDEKGWLLDALAASIKFAKEQGKKQQLVVFGHADTSGDHPINYDISERRARAALALATRDEAVWEALAKQNRKIEEIQRCLKTLSVTHGWPCDPGAVDDQDGPKTQAAVKAFQTRCNDAYKLGLTPDGVGGPKTWKAMHRVVCGLVAERLGVTNPGEGSYPSWDKPDLGYPQGKGAYGCGESFPVDRAEVDGLKSEANRRVDFLFGSGWNFLEAPPDRNRPLTKTECPTYDRAVTEWVAIGADDGDVEGTSYSLELYLTASKKGTGKFWLESWDGTRKDALQEEGTIVVIEQERDTIFFEHADGVVECFALEAKRKGGGGGAITLFSQRPFRDLWIKPVGPNGLELSGASLKVNDQASAMPNASGGHAFIGTYGHVSWIEYEWKGVSGGTFLRLERESSPSEPFLFLVPETVFRHVHLRVMDPSGVAIPGRKIEFGASASGTVSESHVSDAKGKIECILFVEGPYFAKDSLTGDCSILESQGDVEPCMMVVR